ncbi:small acid-soluble spore protein [Lachnospiraceae bacterium KM106-2]|nr:small acid-soluble spore protein [Lachnospiraceae bacterium KM106-2]
MTKKKEEKPIDFSKLRPEELVKYEIAKELGLFDKVMDSGWKSLSAKETGRIGGLITKRKRERKKMHEQQENKTAEQTS